MGPIRRKAFFCLWTRTVAFSFGAKASVPNPVRRLQRSKKIATPSDKAKPVVRPGTESLGFSRRSAQAAEEERPPLQTYNPGGFAHFLEALKWNTVLPSGLPLSRTRCDKLQCSLQ
jgi:hypothetical protein